MLNINQTYNYICSNYSPHMHQKAKVQERTPAFTVVKGAAVPIKPSGPKRLIFVIGMCFVATLILSLYSIKDIIIHE